MTTLHIPHRVFFSFSFPCLYRQEAPIIDGNLKDWDDSYLVPDLMSVDGERPFAPVYMAWNEQGLYFGWQVKGKSSYKIDPRNYWRADCLEVWIDTRDLKGAGRANRYCHHFYFLPGGSGPGGRAPIARQTTVDRAREQAPPCPEESIDAGLRRLKRSYQMEVHLPAEGLNGFQPGEFDRLGLNYVLHDTEHGTQSWTVNRSPPLGSDPGNWGTAELAGP